MQILTDLSSYRPRPNTPLFLALGNFDGVHLAHQALLARLIRSAHRRGGEAAVFTFQEHPQRVLHPDSKASLLTSNAQKLSLLEKLGIDLCFLMPFTQKFSRLGASDFVKKVLAEKLRVHKVYLGYNAHFGRDRKGNVALMRELAERVHFEFEEMPPVKIGGEFVSSSRIRNLLAQGKLKEAARALGRPYSALGRVVRGAGRGTLLKVPTANLECDQLLPPRGVYSVLVRRVKTKRGRKKFDSSHLGPWMPGVLNLGHRPTFESSNKRLTAEVYILDFKGNLYGKTLEVAFHSYLRTEKTFRDAGALQRQIAKDIISTRAHFARISKKGFTSLKNSNILLSQKNISANKIRS